MANEWVDDRNEIGLQTILRDTRPLSVRFGAWLLKPANFSNVIIILGVSSIVFSGAALVFIPVILSFWWWYAVTPKPLAIRYPKDLGGMDPSHAIPGISGPAPADGIDYLGNLRGRHDLRKDEIWENNSDARMHMLVMGTTGSGKTEFLLGVGYNGLAWGSGFTFVDGKADNSLWAKVYSLARRMGRDDDVLVVNFLMGGRDIFSSVGKTTERTSNSLNPFYDASADFNSQLVQSLLPKVSGEGVQWQQKAVSMFDALVTALSYLRSRGEVEISVQTFREYMALPKLVELYLRNDLPEDASVPIKSYLETGLPGFDPAKVKAKKPLDNVAYEQHGYRTGQFTKTFSMLADTYGHIFACKFAEVDMTDVVLNRRILVVMIPSLERSAQESSNLGKLAVAAIKLMMAKNLGDRLEGLWDEIIEGKATNAPSPYTVIMDELGYYFSPGIDVMFAQGRSLGFKLVSAGQDFQAMAKGENKNEVESMIANTKTKVALSTEDPKETFEIFQKSAGEAYVSQVSGYSGTVNAMFGGVWRNMLNSGIEKVSRLSLRELKSLKPSEAVFLFWDSVIRANTFYVFKKARPAKSLRLNAFVEIYNPDGMRVRNRSEVVVTRKRNPYDTLADMIRSGDAVPPEELQDDGYVFEMLGDLSRRSASGSPLDMELDEEQRQETGGANISATDKGILFYLRAVEALLTPVSARNRGLASGGEQQKTDKVIPATEIADPATKAAEIAGVVMPAPDKFGFLDFDTPAITIERVEHDEAPPPAAVQHAPVQPEETQASMEVASPESVDTDEIQISLAPEAKSELREIETLLGNPRPEEAVESIEKEIVRAVKWEEVRERDSSVDEVERLFGSIEDFMSSGKEPN